MNGSERIHILLIYVPVHTVPYVICLTIPGIIHLHICEYVRTYAEFISIAKQREQKKRYRYRTYVNSTIFFIHKRKYVHTVHTDTYVKKLKIEG